mgnify:FL=1
MKKICKLTRIFLTIISIVISIFIFNNKEYSLKNNSFFNKIYNYLLISKQENIVNSINMHKHIKDDMFTNDEKRIYPLNNGTIIKAVNNEIILKTTNGYLIRYSNFISFTIQKYDVVKKNDELAFFDDYFTCIISKNGKKINYEEYIKNN